MYSVIRKESWNQLERLGRLGSHIQTPPSDYTRSASILNSTLQKSGRRTRDLEPHPRPHARNQEASASVLTGLCLGSSDIHLGWITMLLPKPNINIHKLHNAVQKILIVQLILWPNVLSKVDA